MKPNAVSSLKPYAGWHARVPLGASCPRRTENGTRSIAGTPTGAIGASGHVCWSTCRTTRSCPLYCGTLRLGARPRARNGRVPERGGANPRTLWGRRPHPNPPPDGAAGLSSCAYAGPAVRALMAPERWKRPGRMPRSLEIVIPARARRARAPERYPAHRTAERSLGGPKPGGAGHPLR